VRHSFTRSVLRLTGLAAAASAGLLAIGTSAGAATISGPAVPAIAGPSQTSPKVTTTSDSFTCDFSAYGGSATEAGTGTFTVSTTVAQDDAAEITFQTAALPLTSAVAQKLATADGLTLNLTGVAVTDATGAAPHLVSYPGAGLLSTSGPAEIEPISTSDSAGLRNAGVAHVTSPAGFTITPSTGDQPGAPIKCAIAGGAHTYPVTVTADAPTTPTPSVTPSAGPRYTCLVSATGLPQGTIHQTVTTPIPMTLSASGADKTGHSILVTLSSGTDGLGAPYPLPATSLVFAGTLSVQGAQHGVLNLRRTTAQVGKSTFTAAAALPLDRPGALRIYLPAQFTFTVVGPYYPGTHRRVDFITACRAIPGPQIGLRLDVTGQAVSGGGSTNGGGTAASGAVPAGAPNTGGGATPANSLPFLLGGAALLLAGAGGTALALRRRRLSSPSA
jgi:hypothetical protein